MYLLGEPLFDGRLPKEAFLAPASQVELCLEVLRGFSDHKAMTAQLRLEYFAIVNALRRMGADFVIIGAHPPLLDQTVVAACAGLGCRFIGFPSGLCPSLAAYPRDLLTVTGETVLVNEQALVPVPMRNGYRFHHSPYGEGGAVLSSSDVVIACDMVFDKSPNGGRPRLRTEADVDPWRQTGTRFGFFPPVATRSISNLRPDCHLVPTNHIDRAAGLLRGRDGALHLIVAPDTICVNMYSVRPTPILIGDLVSELSRRYERLGVMVHVPIKMKVPYAVNFLQLEDGRVLMTSGDPEMEALVRSIVGGDRVFTTEIPICCFPAHHYAGIRCMVAEWPDALLQPVG